MVKDMRGRVVGLQAPLLICSTHNTLYGISSRTTFTFDFVAFSNDRRLGHQFGHANVRHVFIAQLDIENIL